MAIEGRELANKSAGWVLLSMMPYSVAMKIPLVALWHFLRHFWQFPKCFMINDTFVTVCHTLSRHVHVPSQAPRSSLGGPALLNHWLRRLPLLPAEGEIEVWNSHISQYVHVHYTSVWIIIYMHSGNCLMRSLWARYIWPYYGYGYVQEPITQREGALN